MPTYANDTVHGLSADVYFNAIARRTFGDVVWSTELNTLPLTANDKGAIEPVQVLRRGDVTRVTVPLSDTGGIATLSGVVLPFASGITAGAASGGLVLPVAVPGDDYLSKAQELRLVARDGSFTLIAPSAAVVEIEDLAMSEENQAVYAVTFQLFRATISGQSTPYVLLSGSHATGIL